MVAISTLANYISRRVRQAIEVATILLTHRTRASKGDERLRILFDIEDHNILKRYFFSYSYCLATAGYSISFSFRARFFLRKIEKIDEQLIQLRFYQLECFPYLAGRFSKYAAIVTDSPDRLKQLNERLSKIPTGDEKPRVAALVDLRRLTKSSPFQFHLPLTLGPKYLFSDPNFNSESVPLLQAVDLKHRVIFLGNISTGLHGTDPTLSKQGILRRPEIVNLLLQHFPDEVDLLKTHEHQERFRARSSTRPIVIFDSAGAGLFDEEYWMVLRESAFFLAMPGEWSIHTHSLAEAMAAGCCPIVQEPGALHPEFEHQKNCLSFSGESGLLAVIQSVLCMEPDKIDSCRQKSFELYRQRFSPQAVGTDLAAAIHDQKQILINI